MLEHVPLQQVYSQVRHSGERWGLINVNHCLLLHFTTSNAIVELPLFIHFFGISQQFVSLYTYTMKQREVDSLKKTIKTQNELLKDQRLQLELLQHSDTDMIVYCYTIYTTLFLKNK